jgi:signal transduction histidine kinase
LLVVVKPGLLQSHAVGAVGGAVVIGGLAPLLRRRPLVALAVGLLALLTADMSGVDLYDGAPTLPALLLLTFSAGFYARDSRRAWGAFCLGLLGLVANAPWLHGYDLGAEIAFDAVVVVGLPLLGGRVLRRRTELVATLKVRRVELEVERESRVRDAAAAERLRMARELHDVIVGDVHGMVRKAAIARGQVLDRPELAAVTAGEVEATGRTVLNELRRVLGELRTADTADIPVSPQPSFTDLPALIGHRQTGGRAFTLTVEQPARAIPPDLQLVVYRLVEQLLDAAPADGGSVHIGAGAGAVVVELVAAGRVLEWPGLDVLGRRAAMYGGDLHWQRGLRGGRLRLTVPLPVSVP